MLEFIERILPENLELYLKITGWEKKPHKNQYLYVFEKFYEEYSKSYKIVFPSNRDFEDFTDKIRTVVKTLSVLNSESQQSEIRNILNTSKDILSLRIISSSSRNGSIPLELASRLVMGIKDLIIYSVCNETRPIPVVPRMTKDSIKYANEFRFAQTQKGSYIVNIESQDIFEDGIQLGMNDMHDYPMTRKAIERIQRGFELIANVKDESKLQDISYHCGLNANMCDAILEITDYQGDIEIESKVNWANYMPQSKEIPDTISLKSIDFAVMKRLSDFYRNEENYVEVDIVGYVSTLHKKWVDYKEKRAKDRVVTIIWIVEGDIHYVKTQLTEDDYKVACDAHRDSRPIEISGTLDKSRNRWFLENPQGFRIH
ncbi:MAG: hypothetical protein CVU95_15565 [Firmicutes bacterium HGW-Firmicutes-2]|nr:MAG: hypothetical protein CVU95_15565 [Firmicutes bacterium HGW-Firmicutes-2]